MAALLSLLLHKDVLDVVVVVDDMSVDDTCECECECKCVGTRRGERNDHDEGRDCNSSTDREKKKWNNCIILSKDTRKHQNACYGMNRMNGISRI